MEDNLSPTRNLQRESGPVGPPRVQAYQLVESGNPIFLPKMGFAPHEKGKGVKEL